MQITTGCPCQRIVCVITGCGGGDWPPLLALAKGLDRRGHDLWVICDQSTVDHVQASGLKALCLPDTLALSPVFEQALSHLPAREKGPLPTGENPLVDWGKSTIEYIQKTLNAWQPALVVTSLLGMGLGAALGENMSVPWCFFNPSFYFGHESDNRWQKDFSEKGALMYRHWLLPLADKAAFVLHATDQLFDFVPTPLPPHHRYVGPMFWEIPGYGQEEFNGPDPPRILISVSTSPQIGELAIVKAAIKALQFTSHKVLVTLAAGHDKADLGYIPENVLVREYIPHSSVLPDCRLVISHAGHGIVMKSMLHGVPMVLVPWGRDQPGVAARAGRLGIAEVVHRSDCRAATIARAIRKVLNKPRYLKNVQAASSRLQHIDGITLAAVCIERWIAGMELADGQD